MLDTSSRDCTASLSVRLVLSENWGGEGIATDGAANAGSEADEGKASPKRNCSTTRFVPNDRDRQLSADKDVVTTSRWVGVYFSFLFFFLLSARRISVLRKALPRRFSDRYDDSKGYVHPHMSKKE